MYQFGSLQYLPRLSDLGTVTFDCVAGSNMWKLLSMVRNIWGGRLSEMAFVKDGLSTENSVTTEFVEWREGWSLSFIPRPTVQSSASHPPSASLSSGLGSYRPLEEGC
uniref:Uncharacterized protein n=1 Tax=Fagus sylvatica TaxID=28930 RepID=A0A2N9GZ98_FAGSY